MKKAFRRLRAASASVVSLDEPQTSIAEITSCGARLDDAITGARLNILLPSISKQHLFGGIHTALQLYGATANSFACSRIITLDAAPDAEACSRFADHTHVLCNEVSTEPRQIVAFSDRYGRTLPVGSGDVWLATAWWTAYAGQRLAEWQRERFGAPGSMAYLVQDFEPGFYSWSSRHALALSTYRPELDLAVFNTSLLRDFFAAQGIAYTRETCFEPTLNSALLGPLQRLRERSPMPRSRRIVVYGRPSTQRNAFELICEGLRAWGWSDPRASAWEIVAPGEISKEIDLGPFKLHGLGKLELNAYADLLCDSAVGISLMVSPHPSYPPLEMSAFGMTVLTNRYANKTLGTMRANVVDIETMTPESIARQLSMVCDAWEQRDMLANTCWPEDEEFLHGMGVEGVAAQVTSFLRQ